MRAHHPAHLAIGMAFGVAEDWPHGLQRAAGLGFSPRFRPRAPRGARLPRLRRDVRQSRCDIDPAAPVRTAAVRNGFFGGGCVVGTACPTVRTASHGGLTRSWLARAGGGSHRPPGRSRAAPLPWAFNRGCRDPRTLHACRPRTRLDAEPSSCWYAEEHPSVPSGRAS